MVRYIAAETCEVSRMLYGIVCSPLKAEATKQVTLVGGLRPNKRNKYSIMGLQEPGSMGAEGAGV